MVCLHKRVGRFAEKSLQLALDLFAGQRAHHRTFREKSFFSSTWT